MAAYNPMLMNPFLSFGTSFVGQMRQRILQKLVGSIRTLSGNGTPLAFLYKYSWVIYDSPCFAALLHNDEAQFTLFSIV